MKELRSKEEIPAKQQNFQNSNQAFLFLFIFTNIPKNTIQESTFCGFLKFVLMLEVFCGYYEVLLLQDTYFTYFRLICSLSTAILSVIVTYARFIRIKLIKV